MHLYIRQKVFSWRDKFAVCDVNQNPVYYVESELFTFGKKLHIRDTSGNEVCYIEQQLFRWMPTFHAYIPGAAPIEIKQQFSFLLPKYTVEPLGWQVEGNFFEHEYRFIAPSGEAAKLSKEWLTWGDAYELTVYDPKDAVAALASVIIIDAIIAQRQN